MLTLIYGTIISLVFITATLITAINYEDNDLAKVCRPLDRQLDLLFLLDGSGSVSGNTFATQMAMLNKIIDMIEIGPKNTQIAVMQYSSYTRVEFNFSANPNKESLRDSLKKIRHLSGTTRTGKALDKSLHVFRGDPNFGARLNQNDVAQVAIVVTDGHSHDDPVPAALRLRQAGVQILALGIGAHINMGELVEITGDENHAFQNLTSQATLDQFVHQFKKIAVGEYCDFSRGPFGAEINCNKDSVEIIVSTVNPFFGHLYVSGQFNHPECVMQNKSSKVISLLLDLTSCNIQKQKKQNHMGTLFETNVVLKFHPFYNTKADKVFKVQCFYPEKAKELQRKYVDNGVAMNNNNDLKMPCSYKIMSNIKSVEKCKLDDVRVGDQIIHSWECDKNSFDTYQSMLVHSCMIMDPSSGNNKTVIDSAGSMIKMRCHLRFCDRLLGECDRILPPRCRNNRRNRRTAERINENNKFLNTASKEMNRSWDFTGSINDDDDEYEDEIKEATMVTVSTSTTTTIATTTTITTTIATTTTTTTPTTTSAAIPLLTFHPQSEKLMPTHRRLHIKERVTASENHSIRSLPILLASKTVDKTSHLVRNLINEEEETPFAVPSSQNDNKSLNGHLREKIINHPRIIDFPKGGLDVRINTQNVAIVNDDRLREQYQEELKKRRERMKLKNALRMSLTTVSSNISHEIIKPSIVTNKTMNDTVQISEQLNYRMSSMKNMKLPLIEVEKEHFFNDSFQEIEKQTNRVHIESEELLQELLEEVKPVIELEKRILKMIRPDATIIESQVINVRDLEVMSDPNLKEKWCRN
uniref:VWFA domain-containing protein n=1 Tax=Onchocerca volvulus TaxID=6282 RepID=A0A8R1Y4W4_ONCVO